MRSDPEFDALLRQLLRTGVAPKYVTRLTAELQDHYRDLEDEARRAGVPADQIRADARERLGRCSAIADEFDRHPELLSWICTSEWLATLLRSVASGYVAVCTPLRALAAGPDALMRYTAAGAAGAAVTAVLLLSMVGALSPHSRTVHAMTEALRVPAEGIQRRRLMADAPPAASSRSRAAPGRRGADRGEPPGGDRAATVTTKDGRGMRAYGAGPRPVYTDTLHVDLPTVDFWPDARSSALPTVELDGIGVPRLPTVAVPVPSADTAGGVPKPIVGVLPEYPRKAARFGLEGRVVVEYTVSRLGTAEEIVIVESTHELFHRAALDAAREFRFAPRLVGGEPVDVHGVRTTIRFMLER
ncbi:MAG: energy transducer TonB [Gammaproteobacteria bacterium]|nr:energy transducer TonB [Gammaproteobacteria bacterium]